MGLRNLNIFLFSMLVGLSAQKKSLCYMVCEDCVSDFVQTKQANLLKQTKPKRIEQMCSL